MDEEEFHDLINLFDGETPGIKFARFGSEFLEEEDIEDVISYLRTEVLESKSLYHEFNEWRQEN